MPFEYRPFVNRYVGAVSDVMRQGVEAQNRAALSVAETQAGATRRLGDLTAAKWRGLGQNIAGGVESYLTEQREAPIRREQARLRGLNIDVAEQQVAEGVRTAAQGAREDDFTEALKAGVLTYGNPETGEIDYPPLIAELRRDFPDLPRFVSDVEETWQNQVAYTRREAQFGREETGRREQEQRDRARLKGMQGLALASADPAMTDEQHAELIGLTRDQMLGEGIDPSKITPAILDPDRVAREARRVAQTLHEGRKELEEMRLRAPSSQGGFSFTQRVNRAEAERRFPEAWRRALSMEWQTGGATYDQAIETVRRLTAELAATDPAAAASVDPAIAIAYVGRLFGRPLTPEQEWMRAIFDRRGDGVLTEPPATGIGN
jgi:hypothetical protein